MKYKTVCQKPPWNFEAWTLGAWEAVPRCAPWHCGSGGLCLWNRRGVTSGTVEGEEKRRREWGTQSVKSAKKAAHRSRTVGSSILHHMAFPFSWGFPLVLKQHTYFRASILLNKLKISVIQIYLSFSYFLKFYSMATYREFKCHYHYDRLQDWGGR